MTSKPSQPKNAAAGAAVPNAPALWQQLDAVAKALHGILGGQSSKAVLAQVPQRLREQPQMARRELRVASVLHQRGHQRVFPVCTPEFCLVARPWGGNGAEWHQRRDADGI